MKNKKKLLIGLLISVLFLFSSCSLPGLGSKNSGEGVVIAGGNMTERQILSEITAQMIKYYMPELNVEIINNLGSTNLVHQSMVTGNADISGTMYTGTSLTGELQKKPITDPEKALEIVIKDYKKEFNRKWYPSYGFANTYAFMVREDFAEENDLKTISDLEKLAPELKAGVDIAWMQREGDGYEDFKRIYQFDFKKVYPMEIGLVYNAVAVGEMDIVLGYTTDGRIQSNNLRILEDDKHLFPPYDGSPVASYEIIEKYPKIDKILLKLENTIDNDQMQILNRMADEELIEPKNVAKEFLEKNNYFEDKEPIIQEGDK